MENGNILATFEHSILTVRFLENAKIELEDMKELYDYANKWANGKPYCMLFDALHHYELSEDAIDYISHGNPNDSHVLAKAYVVSTKEAQMKTKLHLMIDKPDLLPRVFTMIEEARKWLESVVEKHDHGRK